MGRSVGLEVKALANNNLIYGWREELLSKVVSTLFKKIISTFSYLSQFLSFIFCSKMIVRDGPEVNQWKEASRVRLLL